MDSLSAMPLSDQKGLRATHGKRPMFTWRLGRKGHVARFHGAEGIRRSLLKNSYLGVDGQPSSIELRY